MSHQTQTERGLAYEWPVAGDNYLLSLSVTCAGCHCTRGLLTIPDVTRDQLSEMKPGLLYDL